MKKTTKSAASPAPATPAKKAAAAVPAVAAPAPVKKAAPRPKAPAAKVDPVNPPVAVPIAAPVPAATPVIAPAAPNVTAITAKIDVGFGNTLFVRGEGPGLSWNKGVPLKNSGSDEWTVSFPKATRPIAFKLLINDETWSQGPDFSAEPGARLTVYPSF